MLLLLELFLALATLTATLAHAQEPVPFVALPCVPKSTFTPSGSGTQLRGAVDVAGGSAWLGAWCPGPDGAWERYVLACVQPHCLGLDSLQGGGIAYLTAADPLNALRAAVKAGERQPLNVDELERWRAVHAAGLAALLPDRPLVPQYVVAPAAANASPAGTRPAYPLSGSVRGTTSTGRAASGQPCKLLGSLPASGADVWAMFGPAFDAAKVTLCRRAN